MRYMNWLFVAGGLVGTLSMAGCVALPKHSSTSSTTPKAITEAPTQQNKDIPVSSQAELWLTLGQQMEKKQYPTDAILYYEKARQLNPAYEAQVVHRLGVLYDRVDEPTRALSEYEKALTYEPKNPDLLNDVGYSYYNRGKWTEAEGYLRRALALDPKHKKATMNLGNTLVQEGRAREAFELYSKIITPAESHANIGFLLAAQGKQAEAKSSYQIALSLDPSLRVARLALGKLEASPASPPSAPPPATP